MCVCYVGTVMYFFISLHVRQSECNERLAQVGSERSYLYYLIKLIHIRTLFLKSCKCTTVIDCEIPPNPEHGYVDTSTGTVFNSLAMYSCDVGYMLDGVSRSVCGPDGIWSPGTPTCPS